MPITISGSTGVAGVDGSASTPAFQGTDTNTGIYFPGADRIGLSEGGAQVGEFDASGNFKFNSGYGSVATAYGCRAWVNWTGSNGNIFGSGGVSSITRTGTGNYKVNFSFTMVDSYYSVVATGDGPVNGQHCTAYVAYGGVDGTFSTSAVAVSWFNATNSGSRADPGYAMVAVFR